MKRYQVTVWQAVWEGATFITEAEDEDDIREHVARYMQEAQSEGILQTLEYEPIEGFGTDAEIEEITSGKAFAKEV
jgi:hypothetical protein